MKLRHIPALFAAFFLSFSPAFVAVAIAPVLLTACSTGNPLTQKITVNLANAQAEAVSVETSLKIMAAGASSAVSAATNAQINAALAKLQSAVAVFNALPSGTTTYGNLITEIAAAVTAVTALVPLPAATSTAIKEGMLLLTALVSGASVISVPAPAAATTGVSAPRVHAVMTGASPNRPVAVPIAIPVA